MTIVIQEGNHVLNIDGWWTTIEEMTETLAQASGRCGPSQRPGAILSACRGPLALGQTELHTE